MDVDNIALEVKKLITKEANKKNKDSREYEQKYNDLIETIECTFTNLYFSYKDFKESELNVSSIEAEGAYRAILTLCNEIGIQTERLK